MRIKRVLLDPNPLLRAPNADVTDAYEYLEENIKRMFKVMYRERGVGLAAPQVGWNARLFVMNPDTRWWRPQEQRAFWNPKVVYKGEKVLLDEGCLSLPHVFGKIWRYPEVEVTANSKYGVVIETFRGFAAQIVQHEMDHLDSRMCSDGFVIEPVAPTEGSR